MESVTIVDYNPQYAEDFKRLNVAWIEKYFKVEEHDLEQLSDPDGYIISKGGYILVAKLDENVVGVCALVKTGEDAFELVKMAVDPSAQGKKIGDQLGRAALRKAKDEGATYVWLESNRILTPAINLYLKLGFKEIPMADTPYERADIKMEVYL